MESKPDTVEYPNFLMLNRCLEFILGHMKEIVKNSEEWNHDEIAEMLDKILDHKEQLEEKISQLAPYINE